MADVTSATVFNVTDRPVRVSDAGHRVPGRGTAVVADTSDSSYVAALRRGDLVVLSETATVKAPVAPVVEEVPPAAEPEPTYEEPTELPEDDTEATPSESKKKQPNKAKES